MLPRHALCTTRSKLLKPSHHHIHLLPPHSAITTSSYSSLTRPCAKPRATLYPDLKWNPEFQRRGAKRKACLNLDDLPQGDIAAEGLPPQDDVEPDYPPLLQQVRNTMLKFNHCVLVTRVGGFYEVCVDLLV